MPHAGTLLPKAESLTCSITALHQLAHHVPAVKDLRVFVIGPKSLRPVFALSNLESLDLEFMGGTDKHHIPGAIAQLQALTHLGISCKNLPSKPPSSFTFSPDIGSMPALRSLPLSRMAVAQFPPEFALLTGLTRLDLSGCIGAKDFPGIREFSDIRYACVPHTSMLRQKEWSVECMLCFRRQARARNSRLCCVRSPSRQTESVAGSQPPLLFTSLWMVGKVVSHLHAPPRLSCLSLFDYIGSCPTTAHGENGATSLTRATFVSFPLPDSFLPQRMVRNAVPHLHALPLYVSIRHFFDCRVLDISGTGIDIDKFLEDDGDHNKSLRFASLEELTCDGPTVGFPATLFSRPSLKLDVLKQGDLTCVWKRPPRFHAAANLQELRLNLCRVDSLLGSIGCCHWLEVLVIDTCGLKTLPSTFRDLFGLKVLELT